MAWIASVVFGCYGILLLWDRLCFHVHRPLGRQERAARWLFALNLVALSAYQLLIKPGGIAFAGFGVLAALAIVLTIVAESDRHSVIEGPERGVHAVIIMITPPIIALLGLVWNFIDGAGFFLRLVLPVSMKHLREVCWGISGYAGVLFLFESYAWRRAVRRETLPTVVGEVFGPPESVSAPAPAAAIELPKAG